MFYITGDTHGNGEDIRTLVHSPFLKEGDGIIITGDFGIGFIGSDKTNENSTGTIEEDFWDEMEKEAILILFCDGNHENFNRLINYPIQTWNGGKVHFIRQNIIHLMRGEIYQLNGKSLFVFGGAFSEDQYRRREGISWWREEMPNDEEYLNALNHLAEHGNKVDYIISHTAPINTIYHMSQFGIRPFVEERSLNERLQYFADCITYEKWYFGHFHIDTELWKNQYCLFHDIRSLQSGEIIEKRI